MLVNPKEGFTNAHALRICKHQLPQISLANLVQHQYIENVHIAFTQNFESKNNKLFSRTRYSNFT